jgi:hypothetical protein
MYSLEGAFLIVPARLDEEVVPMIQLLHVIPASQLAIGDRVRTSTGSKEYLTVRKVEHDEAEVTVSFGGSHGKGMMVPYPLDEEVAIIECLFEEQLKDSFALERK